MKVMEKECKSIISESGIYDVNYSINPYIGCEHGCKYCYAKFMKRFTSHAENWGEFVDVKINSPKILEKDLMKRSKGSILLSSVTDPYQPQEKEYELTRKILKRLSDSKFSINILTKSDLIVRDLEVLESFDSRRLSVGFTINFLKEKDREIWEPESSKISDRLEALAEISEKGIDCYVHVGPFLEGITDIEKIAENIEPYAEELQIESINMKDNKNNIMSSIKNQYPHLEKKYEHILKDKFSHRRKLKEKTKEMENKVDIPIRLFLE